MVNGDERFAFDFKVVVERGADDEGDDAAVDAPHAIARRGEGDTVEGNRRKVQAQQQHHELQRPGVEEFQFVELEVFADGGKPGPNGNIEPDEDHQRDPEDHVVERVGEENSSESGHGG